VGYSCHFHLVLLGLETIASKYTLDFPSSRCKLLYACEFIRGGPNSAETAIGVDDGRLESVRGP